MDKNDGREHFTRVALWHNWFEELEAKNNKQAEALAGESEAAQLEATEPRAAEPDAAKLGQEAQEDPPSRCMPRRATRASISRGTNAEASTR